MPIAQHTTPPRQLSTIANCEFHIQISKDEFLNPIKQDTKKGKLRFVRNCFPHKGYLWNYGAFPRVSGNNSLQHTATIQYPAIHEDSAIDSID
jgi:inorganic pyrophosphatase